MKIVVQHAVGDPRWHPEILRPPAVGTFARLAQEYGYAGIVFTDHPAPTMQWTGAGGEAAQTR